MGRSKSEAQGWGIHKKMFTWEWRPQVGSYREITSQMGVWAGELRWRAWAETEFTDFQVKMGNEGGLEESQHWTSDEARASGGAWVFNYQDNIPASQEDEALLSDWILGLGKGWHLLTII